MKANCRSIFLSLIGGCLLLPEGHAQWPPKKPRFEAQAVASTIGGDFTGSRGPASGFRISGTYNQRPWLGWVVDGGRYQFSDDAFQSETTTLMVGPRFSDYDGRVNFFVQSLFGSAKVRTRSPAGDVPGTRFASAFGGGLDIGISRHVAFRLFEAEFLSAGGGKNAMNSARVSSGVVFRFGGEK